MKTKKLLMNKKCKEKLYPITWFFILILYTKKSKKLVPFINSLFCCCAVVVRKAQSDDTDDFVVKFTYIKGFHSKTNPFPYCCNVSTSVLFY